MYNTHCVNHAFTLFFPVIRSFSTAVSHIAIHLCPSIDTGKDHIHETSMHEKDVYYDKTGKKNVQKFHTSKGSKSICKY